MLRHSHGNVCAEIGTRNKETPLSPRIFSFMLLFPVFSVQVLITDTCVLHVAVEFSPRMRRTLARERPVLWSSCTVPEREMVGGQLAWRSPVRHFALTHRVASCLLRVQVWSSTEDRTSDCCVLSLRRYSTRHSAVCPRLTRHLRFAKMAWLTRAVVWTIWYWNFKNYKLNISF